MLSPAEQIAGALWRIYRRPEKPTAWQNGGNLPWNDPEFARRMLREHLDESHGAASRRSAERARQIDWLRRRLDLAPGSRVLDLTCGPGLYAIALAQHGCSVTGVDFSPASIAYARDRAAAAGVGDRCTFFESDVRTFTPEAGTYDAALFIYGQLAVFPRSDAIALLDLMATALRPGGRTCVELLDPERIDKRASTWWFTDDTGLGGDAPFLHLGERTWDDAAAMALERFYVIHLPTGRCDEVLLCDQSYAAAEMVALLAQAGFADTAVYPAWDGVALEDAAEWIVYVAHKEVTARKHA